MTPARLLAPAALVAAAIALFAVLGSGSEPEKASTAPAATTAPASKKKARATATAKPSGGTYTVKPGDTPSGIAEKEDVDVDDLLRANPDVDADALTVGDELKLP